MTEIRIVEDLKQASDAFVTTDQFIWSLPHGFCEPCGFLGTTLMFRPPQSMCGSVAEPATQLGPQTTPDGGRRSCDETTCQKRMNTDLRRRQFRGGMRYFLIIAMKDPQSKLPRSKELKSLMCTESHLPETTVTVWNTSNILLRHFFMNRIMRCRMCLMNIRCTNQRA